jgi:transcriptional regulator with XRE-family HTH domain
MGGDIKTPKPANKAATTKAVQAKETKSTQDSKAKLKKGSRSPVSNPSVKSAKAEQPSKIPDEIHIKGATSRNKDRLREMAAALGARLCRVRTAYKLTQREVAEKLDMNLMSYTRYESGNRIPDADFCAQFSAKFKVNTAWLLYGGGEDWKARKPPAPKVQISNYEVVPVFEFSGPGQEGAGLTVGDPIDEISVLKATLHKDTVVAIYREMNMVPSITPGAYVGVTTLLENTPMGHIYAIFVPYEGIRLFRAYALTSTRIALRSDNPATPDMEVKTSGFKKLVLAKVEWVFQAC